jgi:hypothetical protein
MITCSVTFMLSCLAAELLAGAPTPDLTKVERAIRKEPAYKTEVPRYCLLVFGPKADYRVWLVLDGDTLYVDRNGNGNLTESGELTSPQGRNTDPCSFKPITILEPDGKTEEKLRFALYGWFDYRAGKDTPSVSLAVFVSWKGRQFGSWGDQTGPCIWGRQPQDAPVLHIDGPLQMGFEVPAEFALERKGDGQFELNVGVGTKGLGRGAFVHLSYANDAIPDDVFPTAVLEFPSKTPGGPPVEVRAVLKRRC